MTCAPTVRLGRIVDQMRDGRRSDPRPRPATAPSSAATRPAAIWRPACCPTARASAAVAISGVFDLEPLIPTSLNAALGLDPTEAARPVADPLARAHGRAGRTCWTASSAGPRPRSSSARAATWPSTGARKGVETRFEALPGLNHFTVLDPLADPDSALVKRIVELARAFSTRADRDLHINGVNTRPPSLLQWLEETNPDVACLQELKAPQDKFPEAAIRDAGYHAAWVGEARWNGVAILSRDAPPVVTRRALPGDPKDAQSRYIEAAVNGVLIGCLYLPNGNPQPGPKFAYKLAWFERLIAARAEACSRPRPPVVLAGDYANVDPTRRRSPTAARRKTTPCCSPRAGAEVRSQSGWSSGSSFTRAGRRPMRGCRWRGRTCCATDALRERFPDENGLYLLGVFPRQLGPQRGAPDRPPAAEPAGSRSAARMRA